MNSHPENSPETNELMAEIAKHDTVDVWCLGCEAFVKMNAAYAKYLSGEIESCTACRAK